MSERFHASGGPLRAAVVWRSSSPGSIVSRQPCPTPQVPSKQRQELLKSNFEKIKRNADELVALVESLQEELGRSNENVLSLKIVSQADKIEKLAGRVKEAAKGYLKSKVARTSVLEVRGSYLVAASELLYSIAVSRVPPPFLFAFFFSLRPP